MKSLWANIQGTYLSKDDRPDLSGNHKDEKVPMKALRIFCLKFQRQREKTDVKREIGKSWADYKNTSTASYCARAIVSNLLQLPKDWQQQGNAYIIDVAALGQEIRLYLKNSAK